MSTSVMKGVPVTMQAAATTGAGSAFAIPNSIKNHTFIIKGSAGISAGKVQCEAADDPTYSGTWAAVGAEQTLVASTELVVTAVGVFPFLRARISTDVVGGTVTVEYIGS